MLIFIFRIVLMVLALLYAVPFFTRGNVAVRNGGFWSGLVTLLVLALVNSGIWFLFAIFGGAAINFLTLGIAGVFLNGLGLLITSKAMPHALRVTGYLDAVLGGLVMTLCSFAIHLFLH